MIQVTLIAHTPEPERLIAAAAKMCYTSTKSSAILDGLTEEKTESFLNMLTTIGHESPIEHATFSFAVEGVSRSLLAQLTRHRLASYSVKSQRYVREGMFSYVVPPEIQGDKEAEALFKSAMENDQKTYDALSQILYDKHLKRMLESGMDEKKAKSAAEKKAIEDARYVLPNACETQLVVTMNARSLFNFFSLRCCNRAQWEIRELAEKMLMLCKEAAPTLFQKAGPPCVRGNCPEGKMSCGQADFMRRKYA